MCGIIGLIGMDKIEENLVESLTKLEYRGYDSSGIAIYGQNEINVIKSVGEIRNLTEKVQNHVKDETVNSSHKRKEKTETHNLGIAHTRWATHGIPSLENTHPHKDCTGSIAIVHNGIIENFMGLKKELAAKGHEFKSETDSEVIVHLIEENLTKFMQQEKESSLIRAVIETRKKLSGSYAFLVISNREKCIIGVREKSPLVIGIGDNENYIASDISPLTKLTSDVVYMDDGDMVKITKDNISLYDSKDNLKNPDVQTIKWNVNDSGKSGYEHYMLKEIREQPKRLHDTLIGMKRESLSLDSILNTFIEKPKAIEILGCGTSYNAGFIAKYFMESLVNIPVNISYASEYRYGFRAKENQLVVAISQSGETADTLAALKEAKKKGAVSIAVTNVQGSSITRETDYTLFTLAGPEIGVAASKTFTSQLLVLYYLGIKISQAKNRENMGVRELEKKLVNIPHLVSKVFKNIKQIKEKAKYVSYSQTMFFIGRNLNFPTALEGALKLKEISYIHAEAYPAGELKHGPLALLTGKTPVVAIVSSDHVRSKMYSNIREVTARNAPVIIISQENDEEAEVYSDEVLYYPSCTKELSPFPISVILQLLAYYTAKERDCPIDKPRNLAKSVTVE